MARFLRDRYFWLIVALLGITAIFVYSAENYILSGIPSELEKHGAHTILLILQSGLFLIAVGIAAWRFRVRGGLATALVIGLILLPHIIDGMLQPIGPSILALYGIGATVGIAFSWLIGNYEKGRQLLQKAHDQLEARVQRRTAQLAEANEQLKRELTERKQAEEALRESEERYRVLLDLGAEVGEAIIMLQDTEQGEGVQTFVSDVWPRITGYSSEELLGMSFFDLIHAKDREASLERHRRKMRGGILAGFFEMSIIRKDGTEVPIELTSTATTYKGKRANVCYIRDITERRQMEERLILTDRLASIGELASGIAHELNNPLTGVIGFSELLLERDITGDIKKDVAIIHHEAKRAAEVVKGLLAFAGKHPPSRNPVNINTIIADILALRAYEQKVNNIKVITHFAPDLPEVMADSFQLQQVFFNIIVNDEHFMTEAHNKGTLTITTERVGDVVRASFADDGPGISKENLGHIFDPFFTTKEVGKGTGLGLSICHGILTEHGGKIYAESELDKGTTFVVELPVTIADCGLGIGE